MPSFEEVDRLEEQLYSNRQALAFYIYQLTLRSTNVRQEHKIAPCYIPGAAWNACRESNALLSASAYSFALSAK